MTQEIRPTIDADLVRRLIADQFPQWANLPVRRVDLDGWDNRTFRLGDNLLVRLPSATGYVPQIEKEHRWLPHLVPHLPLPIPAPVAKGQPAAGYPFPWSVYRWLPGEPAATGHIADHRAFAADLAAFLGALYRIDAADGPPAGAHSFYRGGSLAVYDPETRAAIATLADEIDTGTVAAIWEEALATTWQGSPVWVHGDVAVGNLLVDDGRLSAVIDFGSSAVGDPACDTVIAWTFFTGESRAVFRRDLPVSPDVWVRGRGWAMWKALILIAQQRESIPARADEHRRILREVISDYRAFGKIRSCIVPRGWDWDETLFQGSAPFYARGRPPYAPDLAAVLVAALDLDGSGRLLDVGCGPGTVALLLADHFAEVVGVDPDAGMLAEAENAAAVAGVINTSWVCARAEELPLAPGTFRLATFAQSFHWMDQARVAATIHALLEPNGALVHISDAKDGPLNPVALPEPSPPYDAIRDLTRRYLGPIQRAGQGLLRYGSQSGESEVLRQAHFDLAHRIVIPAYEPLVRSTDDVVAWVYSLSGSAPHLFGDRLPAFDRDLRQILAVASKSGRFADQPQDTEVHIWRPSTS